jgi:hypothetical protein
MHYLRIQWNCSSRSEPDETLVELDERGFELRIIELYRGRLLGFASEEEALPSSGLIREPWSRWEQTGADSDFNVRPMPRTEFETAWNNRLRLFPPS